MFYDNEDFYIAATSEPGTDPYRDETPEDDDAERDYDLEGKYWESRYVALGLRVEEAA